MKIDGDESSDPEVQPASPARPGIGADDRPAAKDKQLPRTRREKVVSIESAIRKGNYQVSPEQTAKAIISKMEDRARSRRGKTTTERRAVEAPSATGLAPAAPGSEPTGQRARRKSGSNRVHPGSPDPSSRASSRASSQTASRAENANEYKESSESRSDQADSDQTGRDQADSSA